MPTVRRRVFYSGQRGYAVGSTFVPSPHGPLVQLVLPGFEKLVDTNAVRAYNRNVRGGVWQLVKAT